MRGLRSVLVVADRGDRWLRLVAERWAAAGITVTWSEGSRRRGSADVVLVQHPMSLPLPRWAPTVHLVTGSLGGRRALRGSVVVRSPAERRALRAELGLRRQIFVVPQGLPATVTTLRSITPTVAVSGPGDTADITEAVPGVRFGALDRAWLLVSAAGPAAWDAAVIEAIGRGVPCVVRPGSALADVVVDGVTGWLADGNLGARVATALAELADPVRAARMAENCRGLAARLSVERGADLLAGILSARANATGRSRRNARPDLSTVAGFPWPAQGLTLRATDEIRVDGQHAVALLHGCDEVDARMALARQGSTPTFVRLATGTDLLAGPAHHIG
jgi:hypothetical protein